MKKQYIIKAHHPSQTPRLCTSADAYIHIIVKTSRLVALVKEIRITIVPHFLRTCFDDFSMTRYQSIKVPPTHDSRISLHESGVSSKLQRRNSLFVEVYQAIRRATPPVGCNKKLKNLVASPDVGDIPEFLYCS